VFVAENHQVWSPDRARKIRRKYGCLVKSSQTNINDMLLEHKDAVFQKLQDETAEWRSENSKRLNGGYHSPTKVDMDIDRVDPVTPRLEIASPETAGREPRLSSPVKEGSETANARGVSGSPNATKYESPSRLPPLGVFSVTTPERMLRDA
jgi:histone deacetylase 6